MIEVLTPPAQPFHQEPDMFATSQSQAPCDAALRQEVPTEEPEAVQWQAVQLIKVGEHVRRSPTAHRTFTRGKYDQSLKRYQLHDCDDINRSVWVRKNTNLVVGFTY
jgi:hypothetical protein